MKKFTLIFAAFATALSAFAEGYQVNTLSARQNGMGHTGTALKLNSESMIFNPAGMAFMNKTIDATGSVTGIFANGTATVDGVKYTTDNPVSTPLSFNFGFSIYDNLKAGISFYTPYGSGIDWTDNWPGALLNQRVTLKTFTFQPTLAWRITPRLSVGAGLMVTWGNVDLSKGLVSPASVDGLLAMAGSAFRFGSTVPASVNLKGTSQVAVGVNVGAMFDISKKWTVGINYRSKMGMKVKSGTASVSFVNDVAQNLLEKQLGILNNANFKAEMPCVGMLNFGVAYRPLERLTLAADIQWSFWSAYRQLDIEFLSEQLTPYNQHIEKNYRNSLTYHLGAQYSLTRRFDLRAGLMIDTPPMKKDIYNPETPGMTKISPSVGFSFRPIENFSIDVALLYVAGLGQKNASCNYPNLLTQKIETFTADYKVNAFNPSIGFGYCF